MRGGEDFLKREELMKNIQSITVIIILIALMNCGESKNNIRKENNTNITTASTIENSWIERRFVLLSFKYDVEYDLLRKILDEYLSECDIVYQYEKEGDYNNLWMDYAKKIRELSEKYNVSTQVISSIILDYKLITKLDYVEDY